MCSPWWMRLRSRRISARVSAIRRRWMGGAISGSVGLPGGLSFLVSCSVCWRPFFGCVCGDGEEGVGEDGEGDMSVPGVPGADLVVVESDFILAGSEALFDGPARSGHVDELSESCVVWVVAVVEREFTVVDGSAAPQRWVLRSRLSTATAPPGVFGRGRCGREATGRPGSSPCRLPGPASLA